MHFISEFLLFLIYFHNSFLMPFMFCNHSLTIPVRLCSSFTSPVLAVCTSPGCFLVAPEATAICAPCPRLTPARLSPSLSTNPHNPLFPGPRFLRDSGSVCPSAGSACAPGADTSVCPAGARGTDGQQSWAQSFLLLSFFPATYFQCH